jgi:hypothetical protein
MQKVNVDVHIWNELRSSDRFGFNICNHYVSNFVPKTLGDTQSAILAEKPPIAGILLPHLLRVHGGFIPYLPRYHSDTTSQGHTNDTS